MWQLITVFVNSSKRGNHNKLTLVNSSKRGNHNKLTLGVSAGLGVAAANTVAGTSLALGSTVVVPIAAGIGAAYAGMKIWNKLFKKADVSKVKAKAKTKSKTK